MVCENTKTSRDFLRGSRRSKVYLFFWYILCRPLEARGPRVSRRSCSLAVPSCVFRCCVFFPAFVVFVCIIYGGAGGYLMVLSFICWADYLLRFINKILQRIHRTNIGSSLPSVLAVVVFRETQKQQRAEGMSMTDQKTTTCRMTHACDILLLALPPNKQTSSFIHIPHTTSRRSIPDRVGATLRSLLSRSSVHRPLKHRKRKSAPLLPMIA